MRRFAGAFVHRQRNEVLLLIAVEESSWVCGSAICSIRRWGAWLDGVWVSVGFGSAILVAVAAFWVVFRKLERGRLGRVVSQII